MAVTKANGIQVWYETKGDGGYLFNIHGSGLGHGNFAALTPLLTENFSVVDFDLRGYGESDKPQGTYGLDVWADDVAALMDALDVKAAHIHGTNGRNDRAYTRCSPSRARSWRCCIG